MKLKFRSCRLVLGLVFALSLAACGGGGAGDTPTIAVQPPAAVNNDVLITGTTSKGPLQASLVDLIPVDAFGAIAGAAIVSTTTDNNGRFTATIPAGAGALLVRVGGGSYIDEADREPDPSLKRRIVLANDEGLESLLPPGVTSITVSVVTQALLDKTRRETQGATFLEQFQANRDLATAAFGFDVLTTAPANPISPSPSATVQQRQYAMLLGGLANLINRITVEAGLAAPTIETILVASDDLSDGRIDGMIDNTPVLAACVAISVFSLNDEIARFQNNNFDAYASTPLLVVNEDTFAQPGMFNMAPVVAGSAFQAVSGTSLVVPAPGVLENATDPNGDVLTAVLVAGPTLALTFNLNPDGSFVYTPDVGSGTDSFTFLATDGSANSNIATVNITIVSNNSSAAATDDSYSLTNGSSLQIPAPGVLSNDDDADGDALTANLIAGPANALVFNLEPDGSFSYSHDGSGSGTDSFSYFAFDGINGIDGSNTATVNLTIDPISLTITGTVPANELAFSNIVVSVDGAASGSGITEFLATADQLGNYSVTINSPSPDHFVSITATGVGEDDDIIFRSFAGSVQVLLEAAGADNTVFSSELPTIDPTYLSTTLAVLAEENSNAPIVSDDGLAQASAAVDSSTLIRIAASLKTVIETDIAIGLETATTLSVLANTGLRSDIAQILTAEFPDQLANAIADIAADSRRPYDMGTVPTRTYITVHENLNFSGIGADLQFNPDGSGSYEFFNGATDTTWVVNQNGDIDVDFVTPFVTEATVDADGDGAFDDLQIETFDRVTLQRFDSGAVADHVFVLPRRTLTYPQDPSIPTEELDSIPGPETARLAVAQIIPFTDGDVLGQSLTASFYHQDNAAIANFPPEFGFDTLDFNSDGTGSSRRRQFAFTWSINSLGVLTIVFSNGDVNSFIGLLPEDDGVLNAMLAATPASGTSFSQRSFIVTRDESLGFDLPTLENKRYRSIGATGLTLSLPSVTAFDFEFSPGGVACRVPGSGSTEWSWLATNDRVEIARSFVDTGDLFSYRTWQPLRQIGNRYWVIETLDFSGMPTDANITPGRKGIYRLEQSLDGNTPPLANDDNLFADAGSPLFVLLSELVANDVDAEGNQLLLAANDSSSANGGTVTQLLDSGFNVVGLKYTPPPGFVGADTFDYSITDLFCQTGTPSTATVTVNVTLPDNTYFVNRLVGDGSVTGVIETNGTIGPLAQSDIIYFYLTVTDGSDTFTLSPDIGSEFILFPNDPAMLTADQSTIFFNSALLGADQDGIEFRSEQVPGDTRSAEWFLGEAGDPLEVIFHFDNDVPFNHSQEADCLNDLVALAEVSLSSINSSPCATNDQFELFDGGTLNIASPGVLLNDTDNNGNALTATLVTAPASASAFNLEPDGSFNYTHDGSGPGTVSFEYEASDGTLTSNRATVTLTINEFSFTVGEVGPGGGLVFYVDPATIDPATGRGTAGLEAAPADLENPNNPGAGDFSLPWGCFGTTTGATAEAIGFGAANTQTIVDVACSSAGNEAAEAAAAFLGGGFSDWFLPSKDELNEMYLNIGQGGDGLNEGGFGDNLYWSSSEFDNNNAWELNFLNGFLFGNNKNNRIRVRAIRVFGNPPTAGTFALAEVGAGGGLVFYLDPATIDPATGRGTAALEAAPADLVDPNDGDDRMPWGCFGTDTGATAVAIGTGATNTQTIVDNACSSVGNETAEVANAYSNNGFTDWFLPSIDELNEMHLNIGQGGDGANEGGFADGIVYWSSSEGNSSSALFQRFSNDVIQNVSSKSNPNRVRAARAFGITRNLNVVAVVETAGGDANETDDNFLTITQVSGALQ